jgi:ribosomal protein L11 methyltransferase
MSATEEPRYPTVHLEVESGQTDAYAAAFFELGASGVEERDDTTLLRGPSPGKVLLVASFEDHADAESAIVSIQEIDPSLNPTLVDIVGDAWRDAWKEFFKPFHLTPTIIVRPPWCEVPEGMTGDVLNLEPGRAFGTGLHATTSLVARVLDEERADLENKVILDAGTGSGILAFVALLRGASKVVAFDVDADVVGVVEENADRNGLRDRLEVFAGTVDDVADSFPWVIANIEAKVLIPIAEKLAHRVAPGGRLVLSGILSPEEQTVVDRYTSLTRKLRLRRVLTSEAKAAGGDSWIALAFDAV